MFCEDEKLYAPLLLSWWRTITLAGALMARPLNKENETLLKCRKVINAFGGFEMSCVSGKEKGMQLSFCPLVKKKNLYFRAMQLPLGL